MNRALRSGSRQDFRPTPNLEQRNSLTRFRDAFYCSRCSLTRFITCHWATFSALTKRDQLKINGAVSNTDVSRWRENIFIQVGWWDFGQGNESGRVSRSLRCECSVLDVNPPVNVCRLVSDSSHRRRSTVNVFAGRGQGRSGRTCKAHFLAGKRFRQENLHVRRVSSENSPKFQRLERRCYVVPPKINCDDLCSRQDVEHASPSRPAGLDVKRDQPMPRRHRRRPPRSVMDGPPDAKKIKVSARSEN